MKPTSIPERGQFLSALAETLTACATPIPAEAAESLYALTSLMLEYNAHTNLTAITEPGAIISRHLADSLSILRHITAGASMADIGSGAGFPALPAAIARGDISVTAIESTGKKCAYMTHAAESLGLANFTVINARAEEAAHLPALRESFDITAARAVASLRIIAELCLPFTKVGGEFIAMKSQSSLERELPEAERAIAALGGEIAEIDRFSIPEPHGDPLARACVIVKKASATPKNYPRKYAIIERNAL